MTIDASSLSANRVAVTIATSSSDIPGGGGAAILSGCSTKLTDTSVRGHEVSYDAGSDVETLTALGGAFFVRTPDLSTSLFVLDRVLVEAASSSSPDLRRPGPRAGGRSTSRARSGAPSTAAPTSACSTAPCPTTG